MAKLKGIAREPFLETINRFVKGERLNKTHPFEDGADVSDRAVKDGLDVGTIGVSPTKNGNYMTYCIEEAGKLSKTSVHPTREDAYGMALRRYMEYAGVKDLDVNNPENLPVHLLWTSEGKDGRLDFELNIEAPDASRTTEQMPVEGLTELLGEECRDVKVHEAYQDAERLAVYFSGTTVPDVDHTDIIPRIMDCFENEAAAMYREDAKQSEAFSAELGKLALTEADLDFAGPGLEMDR